MQDKQNQHLLRVWEKSEEFKRLESCMGGAQGPAVAFGMPEAPAIYMAGALISHSDRPALFIAGSEKEAIALTEELNAIVGGAVYIPAREIQLSIYNARSRELIAARIAALSQIIHGQAKISVLSVQTAMQAMAPPEAFILSEQVIQVAQVINRDELLQNLVAAGYERVDKVDFGGQFRLTGAILDIYPLGAEYAFRIEFFDDEVDSIRTFDPLTQRSVDKLESAFIPAATEVPLNQAAKEHAIAALKHAKKEDERARDLRDRIQHDLVLEEIDQLIPLFYSFSSILDFFADNTFIFISEPNRLDENAKSHYDMFVENFKHHFEQGECMKQQVGLICDRTALWSRMSTGTTLLFQSISRTFSPMPPHAIFKFETRAAAQYSANIQEFAQDIKQLRHNGSTVIIFAGKRAQKLSADLADFSVECAVAQELTREMISGELLIIAQSLHRGFECAPLKLAVFCELDVYGTRKKLLKKAKKKHLNKIELFTDLEIGDYVVHETNGIGIFKGIKTQTVAGTTRDFLIIQYAGTDALGISTDQLDRVQKYVGGEDKKPKLSKLGSGDWKKTVGKVRASVKELAFDLVALYAKRKANLGFSFRPDTLWQKQLEDSFEYEETPDQLQCVEEIKADMESEIAMDRLLCGDVGYGKTEVAVRAAFKAVQDSKQVAFLVPTTILAQQHYQTLSSRFEAFPVNVAMLSRFRTPKQQKETIKGIREGVVDIIVGTHRLLGKDVLYKDLGLLIIDEEQRFGVAHKEQFKNLKANIDVLTLSATPIPRTLHMSMVGIRDLSVIETPPEERYPVQTFVMEYSDMLVREAILKEKNRGGQVYILYNNVQAMERYLRQLRELVPEASFACAHGQMSETVLEKTMISLMEGEFDVLLCSTIIESGLDISNVNTIIIRDSDRLGLSQLYQLRGRVGRTNRLAYAYLTFERDKVLSEVAQKRLTAVRDFTAFGSGFKLAMRDLEIRGAGDLLGAQQHGHMDDVGYDMYCKLVEEAVQQAKGEMIKPKIETQIDILIDAHISSRYIKDEAQRLEIYKRIASIHSIEDMLDVQEEIEDRFSDIPKSVQNLMDIAVLKAYGSKAMLMQISLNQREGKLKFHPNADIDGEKLYNLVNKQKGASIINHTNSESLAILLRQPNMTIEKFMALTLKLTMEIAQIKEMQESA